MKRISLPSSSVRWTLLLICIWTCGTTTRGRRLFSLACESRARALWIDPTVKPTDSSGWDVVVSFVCPGRYNTVAGAYLRSALASFGFSTDPTKMAFGGNAAMYGWMYTVSFTVNIANVASLSEALQHMEVVTPISIMAAAAAAGHPVVVLSVFFAAVQADPNAVQPPLSDPDAGNPPPPSMPPPPSPLTPSPPLLPQPPRPPPPRLSPPPSPHLRPPPSPQAPPGPPSPPSPPPTPPSPPFPPSPPPAPPSPPLPPSPPTRPQSPPTPPAPPNPPAPPPSALPLPAIPVQVNKSPPITTLSPSLPPPPGSPPPCPPPPAPALTPNQPPPHGSPPASPTVSQQSANLYSALRPVALFVQVSGVNSPVFGAEYVARRLCPALFAAYTMKLSSHDLAYLDITQDSGCSYIDGTTSPGFIIYDSTLMVSDAGQAVLVDVLRGAALREASGVWFLSTAGIVCGSELRLVDLLSGVVLARLAPADVTAGSGCVPPTG